MSSCRTNAARSSGVSTTSGLQACNGGMCEGRPSAAVSNVHGQSDCPRLRLMSSTTCQKQPHTVVTALAARGGHASVTTLKMPFVVHHCSRLVFLLGFVLGGGQRAYGAASCALCSRLQGWRS